ncbi:hypothetical protein C2W64_02893 [Brevibacillus laterosporus]|uniref:Nucleotide kinase n=1 Tax=Brevibacillus laterosporus TaxID=1465 RepID=A0A518VA86_BRELA|nr:hypothetical protein [Brevibacillus laterosporus]QDX93905.1 hypothetical protein EEL30_17340 [Brevibacillus laterosporus]RAP24046.1 hypothetical protein C2W64_02893 [Brevibacillus laterosporus]
MPNHVRHIFAAVYTSRGYYSFYDSILQDMKNLYVIDGPIGTGKSAVLATLQQRLADQGILMQVVHSPWDQKDIDALLLPTQQIAIMDGNIYEKAVTNKTSCKLTVIDIKQACDSSRLSQSKSRNLELEQQMDAELEQAYAAYREALFVHDDWERIYISNLDFEKANAAAEEVCNTIFGDIFLEKKSHVQECYFGAATPSGNVDHIMSLTEDVVRFFIKGRPGSGKSTMLKRVVQEAKQRGFDMEIYHCALDPNSLDMVIIPEARVAIFDSTAPHEYYLERDSDRVIDMYERAITPFTDERYVLQLHSIVEKYNNTVKQAKEHLVQAKSLRDQIVHENKQTVNFEMLEQITNQLQEKIVGDRD